MGWYRKVARSVCSLLDRGPGGQTCRALSFLGTWQKSDALGLHPGLSGGGTRRSPPISKAKGSQHNSLCDQWEWRVLDRTTPLSPSFRGRSSVRRALRRHRRGRGGRSRRLHHIAYEQRIADVEAVAKVPSPLDAATGGYPEDAKFDSWVCGQF